MAPLSALAATVSGDARYTSESGDPMRPRKLRLVVEMHRSPAARMPWCPPRQGRIQGSL